MEDSHINMDTRKKRKLSQRNVAKGLKAQSSNGKRNASEETKEKPLLPNYCDKNPIEGKVVLVVIKEFDNPTLERTGAKKDLEKLKYVFVKKLGFKQLNVQREFSLKKVELEKVLEETAEMDYNDTDIFVFAISTHGEERPRHTEQYEHVLMCSDEEFVFTTDIITKFSSNASLAGKPKIFFIQACRIPYGTNATTDANIYDRGHDFKILINPANEETVTKDNEKAHATQDKVDARHISESAQISQSLSQYTAVVAGHSSENAQISQSLSQDTVVVAGHSSENAQLSQSLSQDTAVVAGHSSENAQISQSLSQDTAVVAGHSSENAQISQSLSQDIAVVEGHSSENSQTSQSLSQVKAVAGHSSENAQISQLLSQDTAVVAGHSSENAQIIQSLSQDTAVAGHSSENAQIIQSLSQDTAVVAGHSSENAQISQSLSQDTTVVAGHSSENAQTSQSQGKAVAGHSVENAGKSQQGSGLLGLNSIRFPSYKPCPKDCLVVYAIQSGLYAWSSNRDGAWMFHYLHEVIRNNKKSSFVDFFDVLTKTAFLMAKRESDTGENLSHGKKAVLVIQHRLTKHLCIPLKKK